MKISIIIPTKDRTDKLQKVFKHLENQINKDFEVIVVNDGVQNIRTEGISLDIKIFSSSQKGVSAARNIGIKESTGDILIFIGDDTYPDKFFVEEHFKFHNRFTKSNIAMLGLVKWFIKLPKTNLINKFLDKGIQFDFNSLKNGQKTDIYHFYTSNLSIKKTFVDLFDESFEDACYEDIELGYRLSKKKLNLIFNTKAVVYHDHLYDDYLLTKRAKMMGKMFHFLERKIPGMKHNLKLNFVGKLKFVMLSYLRIFNKFKMQYYHYLYIYNFLKSYKEHDIDNSCSL